MRLFEGAALARARTAATSSPPRRRRCGRCWSTTRGGVTPPSATAAVERVPLDQVLQYFDERQLDVVALHEALDRLMALDERQGLVVSLRFFAGLSVPEVADVLDVSMGTIEGTGASHVPGCGQLGGSFP